MITRKTRHGIIALVLLTAISFWIQRKQDNEFQEPIAGLDPKLNYVLRDFELQFFDEDGQPSFNMQAPVLRNDPKLQVGTIERPVIKLNQPGVVWNLTADEATVTADKEHVQLSGKVYVLRHEPRTGALVEFDTSNVQVEMTPKTAVTDEAVHISDAYRQLAATGLQLDMKTDTFTLKQQVKATYAVN